MHLKPGTLLQNGKYRIEKVLGQGSFGITYLATMKIKVGGNLGDMEATVNVAIKEFFMRDLNGREGSSVTLSSKGELFNDYKSKFVKEARNLNKLNHPNIIKVLDLFEANNTYYYVMNYCKGGSLDDKIKHSKCMSERDAVRYAYQIGMALKYMHSQKMLHLDLKPGNVVLDDNGDAVLIDFGLSKQFDSNGEPESSTTIGLGTSGYAPIEQGSYDGKGFPVTMDVYAFGATIYKILTGKCASSSSVLFNEGFPYKELREKGVSESLIEVIAQAMSPMVKDRFQSVEELLKAFPFSNTDEGTDIDISVDELTDIEITVPADNKINGHEYVDLGLPSGIKWATCNVGASRPEEYGDYFAWGEVEPKEEYTEENYRHFAVKRGFLGIKRTEYEFIGDDISGTEYDAARANWGGSWRLPTEEEIEELVENCTWNWTTQGGKKGYKVTGPKGNSIFLPAAGCRYGTKLNYTGENGYYWSSTPYGSDAYGAYSLLFSSSQSVDWNLRYYGQSVRPVSE